MLDFPFQKQIVGSIFGVICLFGILAGILPSRCLGFLHFKSQKKSSYKIEENNTKESGFSGHHPTCGNFSTHILNFDKKTYCIGCTGMVIGAIISLIGSFLYFFIGFQVGAADVILFWLGFSGIVFGLLQYSLFNLRNKTGYLLTNIIFTSGAFLLLVGVCEITGNIAVESYLLILIIFWITTRIALSNHRHRKICVACNLKSCVHSFDNLFIFDKV